VKQFEIQIKATSENAPDWGLGKGVMATQEVTFPDDIKKFWVTKGLMDAGDNLLKDTVTVNYVELLET